MKRILLMVVIVNLLTLPFATKASDKPRWVIMHLDSKICDNFNSDNGFGSKLHVAPFIYKSKNYIDMPVNERVMVSFEDLRVMIPGSRTFKEYDQVKGRFEYKRFIFSLEEKNGLTTFSNGDDSITLKPPAEFFKGDIIVPLYQIAKFIGLSYGYYEPEKRIILEYDPSFDKQEEMHIWNASVRVRSIDLKNQLIRTVDGRNRDYKIFINNPSKLEIEENKSYRFILNAIKGENFTFRYIGHTLEKDITKTEIKLWANKPYITYNGYVIHSKIRTTPIILNGQWMVPAEFYFDRFLIDAVLLNFIPKTLTLSVQIGSNFYKFTNNQNIVKCYINKISSELKMNAPAVITNGGFYIPLKMIAKIADFKISTSKNCATISLPFGKLGEDIYNSCTNIDNLEDVNVSKGTAKTYENFKYYQVLFTPPTLVKDFTEKKDTSIFTVQTTDDSGNIILECFTKEDISYGTIEHAESMIVKKIDATDELDVYELNNERLDYSYNTRYKRCIGDSYMYYQSLYPSYMYMNNFAQVDPQTKEAYTSRIVVITDENLRMCKDTLDKTFILNFPPTPWGINQYIKNGQWYWICGKDNGSSFDVKRFGIFDLQMEQIEKTEEIQFNLDVVGNGKTKNVSYVKVNISRYYDKVDQTACSSYTKFNDGLLLLGGSIYISINDLTNYVYGKYELSSDSKYAKFIWKDSVDHQWAYKEIIFFKPESIDKNNWTVKGYVPSGKLVTLLVQDEAWLDLFIPGETLLIMVNEVDSSTWLLKNLFKVNLESTRNEFDLDYTRKTFVGKITNIEGENITVSSSTGLKNYNCKNANNYKIGQTLALEYFNNNQSNPVKSWIVPNDYAMLTKRLVYSRNSQEFTTVNGRTMIYAETISDTYPMKSCKSGFNLTRIEMSPSIHLSIGNKLITIANQGDIAWIDGNPIKLSEDEKSYSEYIWQGYNIPLKLIFKLMDLPYSIDENTVDVQLEAYPNPASSDFHEFDDIYIIKYDKTFDGSQKHTLCFSTPELQSKITDGKYYRIKGYHSSFDSGFIFVTSLDEWIP